MKSGGPGCKCWLLPPTNPVTALSLRASSVRQSDPSTCVGGQANKEGTPEPRPFQREAHVCLALNKIGCLICISLITWNLVTARVHCCSHPTVCGGPWATDVLGQPSWSAVAPFPPAGFLHTLPSPFLDAMALSHQSPLLMNV